MDRIVALMPRFLSLWPVLLVVLGGPLSSNAEEVAVVVSSEIRPYIMALNGLRDGLDVPLEVLYLKGNYRLVAHKLASGGARVVVCIGPEAARLVRDRIVPPSRAVLLMILEPASLLDMSGLCGIDLRVPPPVQFSEMARRFGEGARIGVLFSPAENGRFIEGAASLASNEGLVLVPMPVRSRSEVRRVFEARLPSLDVLWFIPDSTVISEAVVSYLVKTALIHGVASVGYNHFFMERGAVMSFTVDYEAVGQRGADLVRSLLSGGGCPLGPPPYRVEWNEKAWKIVVGRRDR